MNRTHVARVWPDQQHPVRAWLTCETDDGQVTQVAVRKIDYENEGPEVLEEFFTKAMDDHMAHCEGQETDGGVDGS